jgi:hypothetical protein
MIARLVGANGINHFQRMSAFDPIEDHYFITLDSSQGSQKPAALVNDAQVGGRALAKPFSLAENCSGKLDNAGTQAVLLGIFLAPQKTFAFKSSNNPEYSALGKSEVPGQLRQAPRRL